MSEVITERGDPRDRIANQRQLVIQQLRVCPCGAQTEDECGHDRDERDYGYTKRRPRQCLNTYDPATAPWPEGF